jgi:toxin ParE1/3/4
LTALRFLEPARLELLGISTFYEDQAHGLGANFLDIVSAALSLIRENPEIGVPHRTDTRRLVLPRFPYSLVYLVDGETVFVIAVAHHRRAPGYWEARG